MPTKSKSDFGKGVLYYPVRQMGKAAADTYTPVPTWDSTAGMSGNEIPTWDGAVGVLGNEIPTWDKNAIKKHPVYRAFPLNTIVFTINFTENLT